MAQGYAGVPPGPLSAWLGVRAANEQAGMNELQQAAGVQGLLAKMQAQQEIETIKRTVAEAGGDPAKASQALLKLGTPQAMKLGIEMKALMPKPEEPFTLRPGEQRFPPGGGLAIASVPAEATAPRAPVPVIKNGRIVYETPQGAVGLPVPPPQPRVEPGPTRGQVIDPKDSTRLLEVDLRKYKGGSLGDVGVFGVAGREPTSAKREEKAEEGRNLLKNELDNLKEHYKTLFDADAIPSSEKGTLSNTQAWLRSTTAGQLGGRIIGSKEQDARNQIQSSRLRVLNAIKSATGMSSQQLNSNVELQAWLNSLTDVGNSYESNVGIIDQIEDTFLKEKSGGAADDVLKRADEILKRGKK